MTSVVIAGCLVGSGLTLLIAAGVPAVPDLRAAVARVNGAAPVTWGQPSTRSSLSGAVSRLTVWLADVLGLARHRADLALTGVSASRLAAEKCGYALLGLMFPLFLASVVSIAGIAIPFVVPMAASVALAVGLSFLPEHDLRRRSAGARVQMRRTVCAYLELVALERAADAGAVEALERAAAIGHGPGFEHIRDALLRARLEGRTPWQQLSRLAEELRVPELGDVADIMRLSGEDGAAVLPTLRARAASLRTSLLQADVAAANVASERMSIPVALLGVAFMALLGFPAFARILFG